ncbi:O-aminophenol oxidase PhsA [Streptomyces hesseae]|uniref:Multicopper oxidase domain-containing protein n=1 Tax=Streptomyces hesseae TaxID=3075519 RepID=A0ABU2SHM2_9ACTN|nr:O-aminophenol oxidase PhsA [Streptomyces sp. DSM 40473]MDT0448435.1 multicopper oxidase domain-containing protein [Streptomyces sp. DSM 40473]
MTETVIDPAGKQEAAAEITPFLDALRVPPVLRPGRAEALRGIEIDQTATWVHLHSQLPPTLVWTYGGHFPGPTIEVRRGRRLRVTWSNRLTGAHPVTAVEAVPVQGGPDPADEPGRGGALPLAEVAALPAWTVTHVHGANSGGGNDGWTENAVSPGDSQLSEYPNDHRAVAWWYHDHAMDITRWNVFAGLAGMYLVRDDEEDALRLPRGAYEIPLIVQDRNLDQDDEGRLTGGLLHKTVVVGQDAGGRNLTRAFTGPYTLVNGVIWPHLDVAARWYRFRVLNAANARTYLLRLVDDETGEPVRGAMWQIGTDGGLLPRPVALDEPLPVAPAERLDVLIDFGALRGRRVRLVNAAAGVRYPQIMQFRVDEEEVRDPFTLPEVVSASFRRLTHETVPEHGHRLLVLTPPGTAGSGHPGLWEMHPVEPGAVTVPGEGVIQLKGPDGTVRTYRRGATAFDDALGFMVEHGAWEQWSFVNLGGPMHPMHIHLIDFQVLGRELYPTGAGSGFDQALGGTRTPLEYGGAAPVSDSDAGWKDVIQVPPGQLVKVIGRFEGAKGRFMYHCHLLEHEDMGMMRPYVVMPREVMVFHHGMGGGHNGGHDGGHDGGGGHDGHGGHGG